MKKAEYLPYAEIFWHEDLEAVRVRWYKQHMKLSEFEEIVSHGWRVLKENGGHVWIADMSDSEGVFPKEIKDFIADEGVAARSNDAGVRWIMTVMPKSSSLSTMSTRSWNKEVKKKDAFVVEEFVDWEECQKWLKSQLTEA